MSQLRRQHGKCLPDSASRPATCWDDTSLATCEFALLCTLKIKTPFQNPLRFTDHNMNSNSWEINTVENLIHNWFDSSTAQAARSWARKDTNQRFKIYSGYYPKAQHEVFSNRKIFQVQRLAFQMARPPVRKKGWRTGIRLLVSYLSVCFANSMGSSILFRRPPRTVEICGN